MGFRRESAGVYGISVVGRTVQALLIVAGLIGVVESLSARTPIFSTAIERIESNPRRFVGETVRIGGEVVRVRSIPLTEVAIVDVYDRTGTLVVVTSGTFEVSDRFRGGVKVLGINTDGGDEAGEAVVDEIGSWLVELGLSDRRRARRTARAVGEFLARVLPAMDASLFAVGAD